MRVDSIFLDVEERLIKTHEAQEHARNENCIGWFFKRGKVYNGSLRIGEDAHSVNGEGDELSAEHYEADDSGGPWETNTRLEPVEDNWIDNAAYHIFRLYVRKLSDTLARLSLTETATGCYNTDGSGYFGREVLGHNCSTGHAYQSASDTHAYTLGQQDLVVFLAKTQHHLTKYH